MKLVQRIFLLSGPEAPRVVVFCGAEPRSGTTGICARAGENLASQTKLPVCLVDGDLRSPSLHRYFGMENVAGLTDSVSDTAPIGDFLHPITENLLLLSAGSSEKKAQALWTSERLRSRIAELRRQFSYVLIDTPAANLHTDGVFFGQAADGVVLVVNSNTTHRDTARKAKENLTANVKLLGAVLNNRTFPLPEFLYKRL
ncbi:MAG TPA: CpsD/CapB family tyrosine-protein kinase [Terriglobia bacterium]|nr:CpsD/CapB family tyrosine-protein kinase [Terriglobia bacterium]